MCKIHTHTQNRRWETHDRSAVQGPALRFDEDVERHGAALHPMHQAQLREGGFFLLPRPTGGVIRGESRLTGCLKSGGRRLHGPDGAGPAAIFGLVGGAWRAITESPLPYLPPIPVQLTLLSLVFFFIFVLFERGCFPSPLTVDQTWLLSLPAS